MSETNRNLNKEYSASSSENTGSESSLMAQIQKIQTHLGFLEKKLDLLLAQQSQPRGGGFGGPRPSSGGEGRREFRPRRPFGGGGGNFRRDRGGEGRPMREGRGGEGRPMREGRGGEGRGDRDDRPREFRGGHGGGGGFKKRRHF